MATTTIATVEDLVRVLDEHPEWLESLRARLLTRELLELPQQLAEFAATTNRRLEAVEHRLDHLAEFAATTNRRLEAVEHRLDHLEQQLAEFVAATNRRFEAVEHRLDHLEQQLAEFVAATNRRFEAVEHRLDHLEQQLAEFVAATNRRFEAVEHRLDHLEQQLAEFAATTNRRFEAVERRFDRLERDLGPLKGAHARDAALREADLIAEGSGLTFVRTLTDQEVRDLVRSSDTAGIAVNQLRSFRRADMILEARDGAGQPCYLAAEVSFTVNGRDTTRATRNAEFLKRFTGQRSYAAVVGLRHDDRLLDGIEKGEVDWYQLDAHTLEVE